jgi:hypothetical protein
MLPNLFSELQAKKRSNFSGLSFCFAESESSDPVAKIYFLGGTPIHFASNSFGEGFSGLLDFYSHQRNFEEYRYEDDPGLHIINNPSIGVNFDRLVINLLESYQEKIFLHRISNSTTDSSYELGL